MDSGPFSKQRPACNSAGKNLVEARADQSMMGLKDLTELCPRTGLMPDDDPVLGEGHQNRLLNDQCDGRDGGQQARYSARRLNVAGAFVPIPAPMGDVALVGPEDRVASPSITTTPNELCAQVHNRMPVILPPNRWSHWLSEEPADEPTFEGIARTIPRRADDHVAGR
jgi:hypothetical protein